MVWTCLEVDVVESMTFKFGAWRRLGRWLVASEEQSRVSKLS